MLEGVRLSKGPHTNSSVMMVSICLTSKIRNKTPRARVWWKPEAWWARVSLGIEIKLSRQELKVERWLNKSSLISWDFKMFDNQCCRLGGQSIYAIYYRAFSVNFGWVSFHTKQMIKKPHGKNLVLVIFWIINTVIIYWNISTETNRKPFEIILIILNGVT